MRQMYYFLFIGLIYLSSIKLNAQQKTSVDSAYKALAPKLFSDTAKTNPNVEKPVSAPDKLNLIDTYQPKPVVNNTAADDLYNKKNKAVFFDDINKIRIDFNIPELAYSVIYDDTVKIENVIGIQQKTMEVKVDDSQSVANVIPSGQKDLFHLGANTKAITAYLIMKLVKQNQLKLNNKLIDIFPDFKGIIKTEFDAITIENLLSHRAGVQVFATGEDFKRMPKFTGNMTEKRKAFAKWVLKFQRIAEKSKSFTYSNAGYVILAAVIESITKENFETYAIKTMQQDFSIDLHFGWPNVINSSQPWGHWLLNDSLVGLSPEHPYRLDSIFTAAGDATMSLGDYTQFIKEQMKGLNGKSTLLSQKEFELMHYAYPEYALGWANYTNKDNHISAHDGSAGTFYAHAIIIKEKKIAVVVLSNSGVTKSIDGIYKTRDFLIKQYLK
jgi:D-alanyl-D-alanine carboxypeptidase